MSITKTNDDDSANIGLTEILGRAIAALATGCLLLGCGAEGRTSSPVAEIGAGGEAGEEGNGEEGNGEEGAGEENDPEGAADNQSREAEDDAAKNRAWQPANQQGSQRSRIGKCLGGWIGNALPLSEADFGTKNQASPKSQYA